MGMGNSVKSTTAWFIISAMVVVVFGSALTWANLTSPADNASTASSIVPVKADPTRDWKTYTNADYEFSFKYPKDWSAQDDKSGDISLTDTNKTYVSEGSDMVPIVVQYNQDNSGASIDSYLSGGRELLKSILRKETVVIGGKTAYVIKGTTEPVSHDMRIVFNDGKVISFSSNATELSGQDAGGDIGTTFSQILSTVQFTK